MNIEVDQELESNPEYRRILAELSPDDRLRLLGKDFNLQRQLVKKGEYRRLLASLSPAEKLRLLEDLRRRAELQKGARHSISPTLSAKAIGQTEETQTRKAARSAQKRIQHFGGRATASGVNYEARIAAFLAVKMLCGNRCSVFEELSGADVSAITLQAPEHVDDIVLELHSDPNARVFLSAKKRSTSIALTQNNRTFTETVAAFVRQFLELSPAARAKSRWVWAIPFSARHAVTHDLPLALNTHRKDAGDDSLQDFLHRRQAGERKALASLISQATMEWKRITKTSPAEDEVRFFMRQVYVEVYDFETGARLEREAEENIRSHVAARPEQAHHIWQKLENLFTDANQRGCRITGGSVRRALVSHGFILKSPPDYADDIAKLRDLTTRNLLRLKEHTTIRFGARPSDAVHISRAEECSALLAAVKTGHLLITGEPGCGKSGMIHELVEVLQKEGFPAVLLLAEDNLPNFAHTVDEITAAWPDGTHGFFITDALDAVREVEPQKAIRRVLRDIQEGQSGWTVVASVREFDLKHSRELRELFPGNGIAGYACDDFAGVAHFHVPRLSDKQLDELIIERPEIRLFAENARKSAKSGGIHRSPFYLRLAAELLHVGVTPARLADWHSPALLLRRFWEMRIREGGGGGERENALKAICRRMVDTRRMVVSLKQLPLSASERSHVDELRSRGILQSPAVRTGMAVGSDEIRFTHHLLHDYAIARSLIPETPAPFCDFAVQEPLLPIFYRQSFMFALEELWDLPDGRGGFWEAALKLESVPQLHGIARNLAPLLAARRVESVADLQPLLTAVRFGSDAGSGSQKALQHLASGLQDADESAIRTGAAGWCDFADQLANALPAKAWIEGPLVHIIARMNSLGTASNVAQRLSLNRAGRGLLAHHVAKEVSSGWRYAAMVAIEAVCRTFDVAPTESEHALLSLLTPERLEKFPHNDLHDLADNLKHFRANGRTVVIRLFEAAFAAEPERDQWEESGSAILSMRFQTSDQWNMIHYALARYYEARTGEDAALMTEAACLAWNAVVRRRGHRRDKEESVLATIEFRGVQCDLVEDYSHIWGREFEHEENRILSHFEKLLREWAGGGDTARLNVALDRFAVRNRTSLMWSVFMEAGAEYPATLGTLLAAILDEPTFLTHPDYAYGATELLRGLHEVGNTAQRERLEKLVLDLPKNARLHKDEPREPSPSWVEHAQSRLLGALKESNIVLASVRNLWRQQLTANALPRNLRPEGPQVRSHTLTEEEMAERRGISLKAASNQEMFKLREALKPFLRDTNSFDLNEVEQRWAVIQQCERTLRRYNKRYPKMAADLWGHLDGACENIARRATWSKTDERWKTVRRILLKAASDPVPRATEDEDEKEDRWPSWGWPSPRIDAARGLPFLVYHLGFADKSVATALRRLARDKSHPLRFNLARELSLLHQAAPELMWELIDAFIANERKFSVLDVLLRSMDRLWTHASENVMRRLQLVADCALRNAPADNSIHETLAHIYLFRFLRTGDAICEEFIAKLLAECDTERAAHALSHQLHACRQGGWLTAGDAVKSDAQTDGVRARTWKFFSQVLAAAQTKSNDSREAWQKLREGDQPDSEAVKKAEEKRDRVMRLVDAVAMQLYFASGAFEEKSDKETGRLSPAQMRRFWHEAVPLFTALAVEIHPHTAHHIVQTLYHLLPCAPREAFLLAAKSIRSSALAGFQRESLAVGDVVKFIQRTLADHREIFQTDSECLAALLEVLDLFVEAGWSEARQLTHRLEEIYR